MPTRGSPYAAGSPAVVITSSPRLIRRARRPRRPTPPGDRRATFAVVDAAFATRRKGLRAALAGWAGSPAAAETRLRAAGIDPTTRGERLSVTDFARLAATRTVDGDPPAPDGATGYHSVDVTVR